MHRALRGAGCTRAPGNLWGLGALARRGRVTGPPHRRRADASLRVPGRDGGWAAAAAAATAFPTAVADPPARSPSIPSRSASLTGARRAGRRAGRARAALGDREPEASLGYVVGATLRPVSAPSGRVGRRSISVFFFILVPNLLFFYVREVPPRASVGSPVARPKHGPFGRAGNTSLLRADVGQRAGRRRGAIDAGLLRGSLSRPRRDPREPSPTTPPKQAPHPPPTRPSRVSRRNLRRVAAADVVGPDARPVSAPPPARTHASATAGAAAGRAQGPAQDLRPPRHGPLPPVRPRGLASPRPCPPRSAPPRSRRRGRRKGEAQREGTSGGSDAAEGTL